MVFGRNPLMINLEERSGGCTFLGKWCQNTWHLHLPSWDVYFPISYWTLYWGSLHFWRSSHSLLSTTCLCLSLFLILSLPFLSVLPNKTCFYTPLLSPTDFFFFNEGSQWTWKIWVRSRTDFIYFERLTKQDLPNSFFWVVEVEKEKEVDFLLGATIFFLSTSHNSPWRPHWHLFEIMRQ